jgi:hypothetical protein
MTLDQRERSRGRKEKKERMRKGRETQGEVRKMAETERKKIKGRKKRSSTFLL